MAAIDDLARLRDALQDRPQTLAQARRDGHTWQEIADAAGLTPNGVSKSLRGAGIEPTTLHEPLVRGRRT